VAGGRGGKDAASSGGRQVGAADFRWLPEVKAGVGNRDTRGRRKRRRRQRRWRRWRQEEEPNRGKRDN